MVFSQGQPDSAELHLCGRLGAAAELTCSFVLIGRFWRCGAAQAAPSPPSHGSATVWRGVCEPCCTPQIH